MLKFGEGHYKVDGNFLLALSSTKSLEYSGTNFKNDNLEELRDLTNITRLKLNGCTALSNAKVEDVLKTMTGLEYLSLLNCSTVTSIDFVDYMTLRELDLEGTNVSNLSKLNDSSSIRLHTLRVNRQKVTNINSYSNLIVNVFNAASTRHGKYVVGSSITKFTGAPDDGSWISRYEYYARGLMISGYSSSLSNSVSITIPSSLSAQLFSLGGGGSTTAERNSCGYVNYDISDCNSIKYVYHSNWYGKFTFPSSLEILTTEVGTGYVYDLTKCTHLREMILCQGLGQDAALTTFSTLPTNNVLDEIRVVRSSLTNLKFLEKFTPANLKTLYVQGWSKIQTISTSFVSTKGIDSAPSLTSVYLRYSYLSDLTGMDSLTNLTTLYLQDNKITDISKLSSCTKLEYAHLEGNTIKNMDALTKISTLKQVDLFTNKISILPDLSGMISLETLKLNENNIENLENLKTLIKSNGTTTLRTLYLDNNPLEDEAINGYDNHDLLTKLKVAGCSTITITETSLSSV